MTLLKCAYWTNKITCPVFNQKDLYLYNFKIVTIKPVNTTEDTPTVAKNDTDSLMHLSALS